MYYLPQRQQFELTRRALLGYASVSALVAAAGGVAAPGALAADPEQAAPARAAVPALVVLFDVTRTAVPVETLRAVLLPFVERGLPVSLVVDLAPPGRPPIAPGDETARFLNAVCAGLPALIELVPKLAPVVETGAFFQMRAATELRAALDRTLFAPFVAAPPSVDPISLAIGPTEESPPPGRLRAAGFLNVVRIPMPGPDYLSLGDKSRLLSAAVSRAGRAEGVSQIVLRVPGEAAAEDRVLSNALAVAERIDGAQSAGELAVTLPRYGVARSAAGTQRYVGLRVDAPPAADVAGRRALAALMAALKSAEMRYTLTTADPADRALDPPSLCADLSARTDPADPIADRLAAFGGPSCVMVKQPADVGHDWLSAGVRVVTHSQEPCTGGVGPQGLRHVPRSLTLTGMEVTVLPQIGPLQDAVLVAPPESYTTRAQRNGLLSTLRDLTEGPVIRLTDLNGFAAATGTDDDPPFELMRATEARRPAMAAAPRSVPPEVAEQVRLVRDAERAWSYFEAFTNPRTGLISSTVSQPEKARFHHRELTLWDIGSVILAIRAAGELGLISKAEADDRLARVLTSIQRAMKGRKGLPPSRISIMDPTQGDTDYSSCDVGRLLSALRVLEADHPDPDALRAMVRGWSLERLADDGILRSRRNGIVRKSFLSHCTHYTARSMAAFGINVRSPYAVFGTGRSAADRMRLLYQVRRIGALGAEPLLLEPIEMGWSRPSRYLADVLFGAQLATWKQTGLSYCVSEVPLPRPPWFSYQGLRVDATGDPWVVGTVLNSPQYDTDAFRRENRMISVKGAFLWAAVHPHAYSRHLLGLARRLGGGDQPGFVSGIYMDTMKPTVRYSDVNTNGIILQAVAHMLRGVDARTLMRPPVRPADPPTGGAPEASSIPRPRPAAPEGLDGIRPAAENSG